MSESRRLTEKDCFEYFRKYKTPPHVIAHCEAVSKTAVRIAEELNRHGYDLDIGLIRYAGLIHDVARLQEHHEQVAADMLEADGFYDEAAIVRVHMFYKFGDISQISETDLVCLGDRLVREDEYVGLEKRVDYLIHKKGENPERTRHLLAAREMTRGYMDQIETVIGRTVDSLFRPPLDYLLKQVEKPARYIGNEVNVVVKDPAETELRFAFAFPDMYEIGMSYMGLQIIYNLVNKMEKICCERVFAPAPDMEALMRRDNYPLFTLETKTPCREMDLLGFTLQYEMSFTNILNMLELSEIPLRSDERSERDPLVIAGGPCAFNPEPLADFIDLFLIGDGEEALPEFLELIRVCRKQGLSREETLKRAAGLSGVYVPSFYEPVYDASGVVLEYKKKWYGAPDRVRKAIVSDLNHAEYPVNNIVPLIETVHDRAVVETFRGCTRGCRFCQAGMIYRPVRERSRENILRIAAEQLKRTGHDELALLSLSTSDYSDFEGLTMELTEYCRERNVSLSLPSLRLDSFSFQVLEEIQKYKKSGLTFAPEAGTQRLRDVINKGITEEDIYSAVEQAIELGWRHVKLYFMIGLPSETDADLDGIAEIAKNIINIHKRSGRGGRFNVTVSISNFVPKAHTPFQWFPQNSTEEFKRKHDYLTERLRIKGVTYNYHDDAVSTCEAVFARGDRRCGQLLLNAHRAGCRFDGWSEYFDRDKWNELLQNWEVDYRFYTERERSCDEVFPWDVIDSGVTKDFLLRENRKAEQAMTTADCRSGCSGCGVNQYTYCSQEGSHV